MAVTKQLSTPHLSYYRNKKINPVFIDTNSDKWSNHLCARRNFYENHLKIPISWFNGKDILEFGPNGGDNSLILAMYGAKITLVEPHQMMHERIRALFTDKSLVDHLIKIDARTLENYQDKSKYDLVIAEGFIPSLPNKFEAISKLFSLSDDFVIFSYTERSGCFFEGLKRALFRRLIEIYDINDGERDQIIELAQRIFLYNFNKLGSARTFDSWVEDILLNPQDLSQQFLSVFDQFIPIFKELDFNYYSGSPFWDLRYAHKWYKNTSVTSLKKEYHKNIPFFITGKKNEEITSDCIQMMLSMTNIFLDYSSGFKDFSEMQTLPRLSSSEWVYAKEINELLDLLSENKPEEIINYYIKSNLCDLWGMPNHYVCLKRK